MNELITFPQDQIDETIKRLFIYSEFFKGSPNQDSRIYAWARFSARGSRIINQQQKAINLLEEECAALRSQLNEVSN